MSGSRSCTRSCKGAVQGALHGAVQEVLKGARLLVSAFCAAQ